MGIFKTGFGVVAVAILFAHGSSALAAREGEFRSQASGNWEQPSTWEVYDPDVGWRGATVDDGIPGTGGVVTIQAGYTVTVSGIEHVEKLRIERGTDEFGPGTLDGFREPRRQAVHIHGDPDHGGHSRRRVFNRC